MRSPAWRRMFLCRVLAFLRKNARRRKHGHFTIPMARAAPRKDSWLAPPCVFTAMPAATRTAHNKSRRKQKHRQRAISERRPSKRRAPQMPKFWILASPDTTIPGRPLLEKKGIQGVIKYRIYIYNTPTYSLFILQIDSYYDSLHLPGAQAFSSGIIPPGGLSPILLSAKPEGLPTTDRAALEQVSRRMWRDMSVRMP